MQFLFVALFAVLHGECDGSNDRFVRVINGVPLNGRPATYTTIRYFGAMASSQNIIWNYLGKWDFVKPTQVICGGSFLTAGIFQTACHCLGYFDANDGRFLNPSIVEHHWEGRAIVYPGVSNRFGDESMEKYSYVQTVRFFLHAKCAQFGKSASIRYDYAIAQLDATWINVDKRTSYPFLEIEWAPMYNTEDFQNFYNLAFYKQLVCLLVGFGGYSRGPVYYKSSDVLRTGWNVILPFRTCIKISTYVFQGKNLTINENVNWVCTYKFSRHDQQSAKGDSGSPLTCDNRYHGITSGAIYTKNAEGLRIDATTKHAALVHTLFTNAIDYRKSFLKFIDDQSPADFTRRQMEPYARGHSSLARLQTFPDP